MKPTTTLALRLLEDNDVVTTHDFLAAGVGSRFGARIAELRHEFGCVIDEWRLKGDVRGSGYRLLSGPVLPEIPEAADACDGRQVDDQACPEVCPGSSAPGLFDADHYAEMAA